METIPLGTAADALDELARHVERGETVVVTRDGRPILDLVPHEPRGGVDLAAGEAFLRSAGIVRTPGFIPDDFDDPLPEDFLIRPLPEPRG